MNFVSYILENGGMIKPLLIPPRDLTGPALMNPSVIVIDGKIIVNLRNVNYTLYHAEKNRFEHAWGPLSYIHPENDIKLRTTNYIAELDSKLNITTYAKIDTSQFDTYEPKWDFVGLEDARLIRWDNKIYMCGVRRDLDTKGTGRMELSELEFSGTTVKEVSRYRIPGPPPDNEYCMKNCTPVEDMPYTLVKWTNPTALMIFDPSGKETRVVETSPYVQENHDMRGGSQVLRYRDGYITIIHETYLYTSEQGKKDAIYRHRFVLWDKDFRIKKFSKIFSFLDFKIEFCCGLARYEDDYLITFGAQDNAAYIAKISSTALESFIHA
jgi:hypothetical protein